MPTPLIPYPDVSEVLRGETLAREDDTWIRLLPEKRHLAETLSIVGFRNVLEIGCGTGLYATILTQMYPGITYLGVDSNPEALAIARRRNPKLTFIESDFRDFNFPSPSFTHDLVCAHAFLKHFCFDDWEKLFPKFLSLGRVAQFDMQTATPIFNDGSPTFGNNLWVPESLLHRTLTNAGHVILSSWIAYEKDNRRATIYLTEARHAPASL